VAITQSGPVTNVTMTLFPSSLILATNGAVTTSPQPVSLTFAGGTGPGPSWTASSNQPNITVSPISGVGNTTLMISATGSTNGAVTINALGASNSPQKIQVQFTSAVAGPPFGSFDTPSNNTHTSATIAVTGWALDAIGVTKVDIWREQVGPEPVGLYYIGDAIFVSGARPDVASSFSTYPSADRAGWGYSLLTNFLPNANGSRGSGNGLYVLHALAHNRTGVTTDLGARAIWVDNADTLCAEFKAKGVKIQKGLFPWAASGRAITLDRPEGMTKLLVDPQTERVLGVGIVGAGAGELIAEGVLAIEMAALASDLELTIHPHPTLSETIMESAEVFFGTSTDIYRPKRA